MSSTTPETSFASWDASIGRWWPSGERDGGLFAPSEPSSVAWPTSGMTRSGTAYALPTWVHRTDASGSSSSRGLLPTPKASNNENRSSAWANGPNLGEAIAALLPTPRATDGTKGGPNQRGSSGDLMLPSAVQTDRWGDYEPAIARWERVIDRPAPNPTKPGRTGKPRLNPELVEWMMGWPPGHVTNVPGVTDPQALRICGNGVVPQQAAAATRALLHDLAREAATA